MKNQWLMIIAILFSSNIFCQKIAVKDINTKKPLPFVNVKFANTNRGLATDLDGVFDLENVGNCKYLKFSFVGYSDTIINTDIIKSGKHTVYLRPKEYILSVVEIHPGINPALAIIQKVIDNEKINNPEKLKRFSYSAYHKFIVGLDSNSIKSFGDSIGNKIDPECIFISENVSNRTFKYPNNSLEKVVASRTSGFKLPMFALLSSQLQSFSFYDPEINVLNDHYPSPFIQKSLKNYSYTIVDTVYSNIDTTFVITFKPMYKTNFDGMRGVVQISSLNYAIKNVIAEPYDTSSISIKIEQNYELIDSTHWFPRQLNTTLTFNNISMNNSSGVVGMARTYIKDVKINEDVLKQRIGEVAFNFSPDENKTKDENFWSQNRSIPLDTSEIKAYEVIDSIGKEAKLDQKMYILKSFRRGGFPIGIVDVKFDKFIKYNDFEGFRMGLGLRTNTKLSKHFDVGGYSAWSTKDFKWKYGGDVNIFILPSKEMVLNFGYKKDVFESAAQQSFSKVNFFSQDIYRDFLISKMEYFEEAQAQISSRFLPYCTWSLGMNYQIVTSPDNYTLKVNSEPPKGDFNFAEAKIGLRFAYKEKLSAINDEIFYGKSKFPILQLQFTQNLPEIKGVELSYRKLDLQIDYSKYFNFIGKSSIRIAAAYSEGNLPWYKLYNGKGSYKSVYLNCPNSFGTMRINEFLSSEFIAFYYTHDFGKLLFGDKKFIPQPSIVTNYTIGKMTNPQYHNGIQFNTLDKGYGESGLLLNSILRPRFVSLGFGIYYRWGYYAFANISDNFAYKITLSVSLN